MTGSGPRSRADADGLNRDLGLYWSHIKAKLLWPIRSGRRRVLWVPEYLGLGNLLYYWLRARVASTQRRPVFVLETQNVRRWISDFPSLCALTLPRTEVRLRDRRSTTTHVQTYGVEFSREQLDSFIDAYLLSSKAFLNILSRHHGTRDVVLNVRVGDYYRIPKWRGIYSFDIRDYVETALGRVSLVAPIKSLSVVSDDIAWCRQKLANTLHNVGAEYIDSSTPQIEQFAILATARRLILANSTFSYWAGYVASRIRSRALTDGLSGTWAPWFHRRDIDGGRAYQLDPLWNIIDQIPGGWDG